MYFVYIIKSSTQDILYKGFTENPEERLRYHNENRSRYTSGKGPWTLVFIRSFEKKSEALKYEKQLKRQNRKYLDWLILSDVNEL